MINPVSSDKGIKLDGGIKPRSGCCQRINASKCMRPHFCYVIGSRTDLYLAIYYQWYWYFTKKIDWAVPLTYYQRCFKC